MTVTWSLPRVEVHVPPEVQATCLNIGCRVYMLSADASSKQPTVEGEGGGGGDAVVSACVVGRLLPVLVPWRLISKRSSSYFRGSSLSE